MESAFWYIVRIVEGDLVVRLMTERQVARTSPAPYGPYASKEEAEREVPFVVPRADWTTTPGCNLGGPPHDAL